MTNPKKILHLNLDKEYFLDIKSGCKKEEYREVKDFWTKRLVGKIYHEIHIKLGYPKPEEKDKIIILPWRGFEKKIITHKKFDNIPKEVYAIKLERISLAHGVTTPDGTTLWSRSSHDFVSHIDTVDGKSYFIDGGGPNSNYLRLGGFEMNHPIQTVFSNDEHKEVRKHLFIYPCNKMLKKLSTTEIKQVLDNDDKQDRKMPLYVRDALLDEFCFKSSQKKRKEKTGPKTSPAKV